MLLHFCPEEYLQVFPDSNQVHRRIRPHLPAGSLEWIHECRQRHVLRNIFLSEVNIFFKSLLISKSNNIHST